MQDSGPRGPEFDTPGLYEEYGFGEKTLSGSAEFENLSSEERYLKLFTQSDVPLKNLRIMSAYIFSIACSNAHTERVFSMMTTAWRNERNRLEIDSVKAELQVCINFSEGCTEMYHRFLSNRKLMEAARSMKSKN